jgi:hypothetical protein
MKKLFLLLLGALVLFGCSGTKKSPPMVISTFTLFETVSFTGDIDKAFYHTGSKTICAMQSNSQQIVYWRNGKQQNTIGGMGNQASNFRSLADFVMAEDGNLYALDAVAKVIKKFNADGKLLGSMELNYVQQPSKLALGSRQNIFVYDSAGAEIIAYDLLDQQELYRFGKFELNRVDLLFANRDYVIAYDSQKGQSALFSSLGQFIAHDTGQVVYDTYNNAISLTSEAMISKMSAAWLPMTPGVGLMTIMRDTIAIVVGNQVRLLKLDYAPVL